MILVGDGLGDRPVPALGDKTPLEAQPTPNLDALAARGQCGLMDAIAPGVPAGSDTSHFAMLGYDPYQYYTGRGPLEALGVGLEVMLGDLGFRCNFATVKREAADLIVVDRRADRIASGTDELTAALNSLPPIDDIQFIVKDSIEHRAALVMRGPALVEGLKNVAASPKPIITDADPQVVGAPMGRAAATVPEVQVAAAALNLWIRQAHDVLKEHPVNQAREANNLPPANAILPRGCGMAPDLDPFEERHGTKGGLVVEAGLIKGLGRYIGMDVLDAPGATGGYDTDHISLAKTAVAALDSSPFVLCNLKAPDLAGHDGDPEKKMEMIAKLDEMAGVLLNEADLDKTAIAVTGDHSTPCALEDHSGDPLPLIITGYGVRADAISEYGERPCGMGSIGRVRGHDILPMLTTLIGTAHKFGA
jgi:2,3-bisphosphoglycerate-independent phosphoglycerate mutase